MHQNCKELIHFLIKWDTMVPDAVFLMSIIWGENYFETGC
jgi:hypothetical protein